MGTLLALAVLTALAQETFAANKDIDKVFATSDGNIFLPSAHNLARNHARQEKLEVHEISRTGGETTNILDHIQTDAKANELKHEADVADAAKLAASLPSVPATGQAVPIEAAALAQAAGKSEAVEETTKVIDAPAAEGTTVNEANREIMELEENGKVPAKATSSKPAAAKKPAAPKKAAATTPKPAAKAEAKAADKAE